MHCNLRGNGLLLFVGAREKEKYRHSSGGSWKGCKQPCNDGNADEKAQKFS